MQRFTPTSPTKCVMRYEVYRNKFATDADFTLISDMYKRIMSEDKYLCINTQQNLNKGVFVNGELHPEMEAGPIHFQRTVRDVVTEHREKEEAIGQEIWPAQHQSPETVDQLNMATLTAEMGTYSRAEDDFQDSLKGGGLVTATPIVV
ncbi:hypothetical protein MW887_008840 [Aspergillus wentii]|nr:hypothetical protein MW887_008840 [Aspergillus wentii]